MPTVTRGSAGLLLNAVLGIVALALAFATPGEGAPRLALASAGGSLSLSNSHEGVAIFHAADMRPGEQASGTVTIGNTGTVPATLVLSRAVTGEAPGTGGGQLSDRLDLLVIDVTDVQQPVTKYSGPLEAMGALTVGSLAPADQRSYLVVATLPRGGTADNAYQGAQIAAGFTWTAQEIVAATPTPTPTPTASPAPIATPVPTAVPQTGTGGTPTPTPTPVVPVGSDPTAGGEVATIGGVPVDQVLQLPPAGTTATSCISRRVFVIHIRAPHGVKFKSVLVTVNRKTRAKMAGKRVKTKISLRGLPKGTVKVKILAVTSKGEKVAVTRTYHTCTTKTARKKRRRRR